MTINSSSISDIVARFVPQIFEKTAVKRSSLWNRIPRVGPSSPQGPRWRVETAAHSGATTFAEGGSFPAADEFEQVQAALDWGRYVATVRLTGDAEDQLAIATEAYIQDYFMKQVESAIEDLVDEVDGHLRGGVNTNGVTGVTAAISDTGTYAGLLRSTYTAFQSYQNDNTGTPRALTLALMQTTFNNFVETNAGRPVEIWTSQDQFDAYSALATSAQQNLPPEGGPFLSVAGPGTADRNLPQGHYKGIPIYVIPGYATDRIDFVDPSKFRIEVLRDITVRESGRVNDDMHWDITLKCQMVLTNPRKGAATLIDLS